MRGSTAFLLSFGATALLGVLVVGPALEEVVVLREEILATEVGADSTDAEARVATAAEGLAGAMGLEDAEGGAWAPGDILRGIPTVRDVAVSGERRVSFSIEWNRLSELLVRLGDGRAPPLEEMEAAPSGEPPASPAEPPRCRVSLTFFPLPAGFTPR